MKSKFKIENVAAPVLFVVGVVLTIVAFGPFRLSNDTAAVAERVSATVERRIVRLEAFMAQAMREDHSRWLELDGLPGDMVIYRYCGDTLQSWRNEFPVYNDNLQYRMYTPMLTNSDFSLESPLTAVADTLSYVNLGSRWYLAKILREGDCTVVGGLEITGTMQGRMSSGTNARLKIPESLSVRPIATDGGSPVLVMGRPMFKIVRESLQNHAQPVSYILWAGIAAVLCGALLWLSSRRTLSRLRITMLAMLLVLGGTYVYGWSISDQYAMFSPRLYAGNGVLYSLGAVVLINLAILTSAWALYISRDALCGRIRTRTAASLTAASVAASIAGILAFTFFGLRSIIINSGICLELYRLSEISVFSIVVYVSFISMLVSVPLLLQTFREPVSRVLRRSFDAFSLPNRIFYALLISVYLVSTAGVLGFRKEQDRMEMLANRLAFDRDISLELYLRGIEAQIADDPVIAALSAYENTAVTIQNRILVNYFSRRDMNYAVTVYVFNKSNNNRRSAAQYNALVRGGQPVADNSRFLYVRRDNGRSYYVGMFLYLLDDGSISRVMLRLESREMGSNRGYADIFGIAPPGRVALPDGFSYARYEAYDLKENRGGYAYPTMLDEDEYESVYVSGAEHLLENDHAHFVTRVGENEAIILSRTKISAVTYLEAGVFLSLVVFLLLTLFGRMTGRQRHNLFEESYFRSRITGVLLVSQFSTLLVVSAVSVLFIYSRNESNMHTAMSDKIGAVTAMVEAESRDVDSFVNMERGRLLGMIRKVSDDTDSDISIWSPSGTVLASTTPFVFERMLLSSRISSEAYGNIIYGHQRYCILQEKIGRNDFYSMCAPVIGDDGRIIAIVSSPYSGDSFDFGNDAITHLVTIISFFFLLLLVSMFTVTAVVDRMFRPLSEMSRKMDNGGLDSMEPIEYDRKDEVYSIVQAYNSMVAKLSESSRRLASAERDKAWSEMARQVAHEIKNPLTPMKLQLQRVMRLKAKGDPRWQELFDEAGSVLLDHIDILAKTAEDFSTFAKLYSEEPVEVDLDRMLQDEVSMFDNRSNIRFDYLGLEGARALAPKPQLTRVFVNLLNNAVQAIGDSPDGHIAVSLRLSSSREGYYDIVFEDNGPGVKEENVSRLFTPNFTTKDGGSGLGLAMSRNILERSGATIGYSRSFALGGACFTICYPMKSDSIS